MNSKWIMIHSQVYKLLGIESNFSCSKLGFSLLSNAYFTFSIISIFVLSNSFTILFSSMNFKYYLGTNLLLEFSSVSVTIIIDSGLDINVKLKFQFGRFKISFSHFFKFWYDVNFWVWDNVFFSLGSQES